MTAKEQRERDVIRIEEHLTELVEHFDSVHIFVTRGGEDGTTDTVGIQRGRGNVYARQAQVREWMIMQDQHARNHAEEFEL